MNLKVLLPSQIFAQQSDVRRVVAETREGSFGILPHRLDCVAGLVPGILLYETEATKSVYIAVDEGVLVKSGMDVLISVRRAMGGTSLADLHAAVKREFLSLDSSELEVRKAITRVEAALIARFAEFQRAP